MNKSILLNLILSFRPEWVEQILNGKKTIEVRTQFPENYKGWVYIYCTKNGDRLVLHRLFNGGYDFTLGKQFSYHDDDCNGKVVARFWCDNVGIIKCHNCLSIPTIAYTTFADKYYSDTDLQTASCLNGNELMWYLGTKKEDVGYAIHISKLEIFDRPKELSEFNRPFPIKECKNCLHDFDCAFSKTERKMHHCRALTKAPQNYCYVEGEE